MISYRILLAALLGATVLSTGLAAQAVVQPLGQTDADLLAAQMRRLASDPRDMTALATAGELSLRLGDLSGAAALFARADKIDPRNGRVKAGMGSILVRSERPGEALRFFSQAEAYDWPVARYAADRGLAFDLVGQQDRAQRDYRLALQNGADDETARRYALSLGISGKQAQALEQLDPLVRRQDRAAWRARAFVMAMNGDTAGAARIATTMMPAGMAQGLGAFFQRLPTLPAIDRAFAVHFGEIYATPARIADARLTPAYAPLPPDPVATAAVQVATIVPGQDRRSRRERERAERDSRRVVAVRPVATPVAVAAAVPSATPTSAAAMRESDVRVVPTTTVSARPVAVATTTRPAPAMASVMPTLPSSIAAAPPPAIQAATVPSYRAPTPTAATLPPAVRTVTVPSGATVVAAIPTAPRPASIAPASIAPAPITAAPLAAVAATAPSPVPATSTVAPVVAQASVPVAPVSSQAATERTDSVLARIVASLSIPASELGVVEPGRPDPSPVPIPAAVERVAPSTTGRRVVAEASAKEGRDAALRRTVAARLTGDAEADEPVATRGRRGATTLAAADPVVTRGTRSRRGTAADAALAADDEAPPTGRRPRGRRGAPAEVDVAATDTAGSRTRGRRGAADQTELADADASNPKARGRHGAAAAEDDAPLTPAQRRAAARKAAADKKAAAEKKELADQAAAEKKAARSNPPRIWVQVAGGANEGDLGKAWSAAQAKASALKGRAGYKTPLRATNRVLTGPFKTDAEARAFVNQLGKQGVSAFSFTSDAGQKVEKLGSK